MDLSKTGLFISTLRKQNDMTQKELAEKIGVTDKAVSRWETGKGFPDVSLLVSLASTLGVSVSEIVMGEKIEVEEKGAIDLMEKMNKTVIDTLDYSQQEIKKSRWKNVLTTSVVLLFSIAVLFAIFMEIYNRIFWPHIPMRDVLYGLLIFILIPIGTPIIINSVKDKYSWITPRKSFWISPLAAFILVLITTAILFPQIYWILFNPDPLYGYSDTPVGGFILYLIPINLLISISITAICYAVNRLKIRVK